MEKKALSVVLMVALLATSFMELQARVDLFTELTAGVGGGEKDLCCAKCINLLIWPPQYVCTYVKHYCPSACKNGCVCTKSIPPICTCTVTQDQCKLCKTTGVKN